MTWGRGRTPAGRAAVDEKESHPDLIMPAERAQQPETQQPHGIVGEEPREQAQVDDLAAYVHLRRRLLPAPRPEAPAVSPSQILRGCRGGQDRAVQVS